MAKIVPLLATAALCMLGFAAVTTVHAAPKEGSGSPRCKAPWGEIFAGGETIQLREVDAKGNLITVTYVCGENGWTKVAKAAPVGPLKIAPGQVNPTLAPTQ